MLKMKSTITEENKHNLWFHLLILEETVQMKKRFTCVILLALFIYSLAGCFPQSINKEISSSLGISIPYF